MNSAPRDIHTLRPLELQQSCAREQPVEREIRTVLWAVVAPMGIFPSNHDALPPHTVTPSPPPPYTHTVTLSPIRKTKLTLPYANLGYTRWENAKTSWCIAPGPPSPTGALVEINSSGIGFL